MLLGEDLRKRKENVKQFESDILIFLVEKKAQIDRQLEVHHHL